MSREFRTLAVHFFSRFFDREERAAEAESFTRVIQLLALLIVLPFLTLFLLKSGPVGDRYLFVCYAMVVMGFVMTLKWDMLFPDRRDYLILSPLPIPPRRMFLAKTAALVAFLSVFAVAINLTSIVLLPTAAHVMAVVGASIFTALSFAALQGILINVVSPSTFRRVSPRIQMASIAILVITFLTLPLFKNGIIPLSKRYPDALGYLPPVWFLGLYESFLPGATDLPMATIWARSGLAATVILAVICGLTYLAGYRRYSQKLLESIDSDAIPPSLPDRLICGLLNRTILRDPFQRATFYFIGKIANRSAKHRIMTAMYIGVGTALALVFAFILDPRLPGPWPFRLSSAGSLEAPLMLAFILITGLRTTFNTPYELGANWIFQVTAGSSADFLEAVRKWAFLCRIVPMSAVVGVFEFVYFAPLTVVAHLGFDLILSAVLIELFFLNFNKVPFTCEYPRDNFRLAALAIGYFYGFVTYAAAMGGIKRSVTANPLRMIVFVFVSIGLLSLISIYRRRTRDRSTRIVYEEADPLSPLSIAADQGYWLANEHRQRRRPPRS